MVDSSQGVGRRLSVVEKVGWTNKETFAPGRGFLVVCRVPASACQTRIKCFLGPCTMLLLSFLFLRPAVFISCISARSLSLHALILKCFNRVYAEYHLRADPRHAGDCGSS